MTNVTTEASLRPPENSLANEPPSRTKLEINFKSCQSSTRLQLIAKPGRTSLEITEKEEENRTGPRQTGPARTMTMTNQIRKRRCQIVQMRARAERTADEKHGKIWERQIWNRTCILREKNTQEKKKND